MSGISTMAAALKAAGIVPSKGSKMQTSNESNLSEYEEDRQEKLEQASKRRVEQINRRNNRRNKTAARYKVRDDEGEWNELFTS